MTVKDLLPMEIDVDVVDDVCEELYIAFCGPVKLTEEGQKHFADALEIEVKPTYDSDLWLVCVDDADESVWKHRLKVAKQFFRSAAGYCADSDFKKWFSDV